MLSVKDGVGSTQKNTWQGAEAQGGAAEDLAYPVGMSEAGQRLIAVEVVVSGVITAPLDAVWDRVSCFTDMGDWLAPMHGERVRTSHLVSLP